MNDRTRAEVYESRMVARLMASPLWSRLNEEEKFDVLENFERICYWGEGYLRDASSYLIRSIARIKRMEEALKKCREFLGRCK